MFSGRIGVAKDSTDVVGIRLRRSNINPRQKVDAAKTHKYDVAEIPSPFRIAAPISDPTASAILLATLYSVSRLVRSDSGIVSKNNRTRANS